MQGARAGRGHPHGNQISRTKTGGSQTIDYTPFNLPESVTTTPAGGGAGVTTEFTYDAQGDRIRKSAQGITTDYHAGIYERTVDTGAGTTTHKYWIYAGLRKIAQVEHVVAGSTLVDEATLYLHPDALGSTSAISGTVGVHVNQQFEPFGEREPGTDPAAKKVTAGLTGHEHDDDLGFINMRGRIQDPHIGNFLSADPYVSSPGFSQSFNRYSYVVNNPLNYVDPTGFQTVFCGPPWTTVNTCVDGQGNPTKYDPANDVKIGWLGAQPGSRTGADAAVRGEQQWKGEGLGGDGPDGGPDSGQAPSKKPKCDKNNRARDEAIGLGAAAVGVAAFGAIVVGGIATTVSTGGWNIVAGAVAGAAVGITAVGLADGSLSDALIGGAVGAFGGALASSFGVGAVAAGGALTFGEAAAVGVLGSAVSMAGTMGANIALQGKGPTWADLISGAVSTVTNIPLSKLITPGLQCAGGELATGLGEWYFGRGGARGYPSCRGNRTRRRVLCRVE